MTERGAAQRQGVRPLSEQSGYSTGLLKDQSIEREVGLRLHRLVGTTTLYSGMPVIAIFFGIVIRMYYKEHEPRHFHAEHQSQQGKFDFDGNQTIGNITSKNALALIREWAQINRTALDANWSRIKAGQPLNRIPPLE